MRYTIKGESMITESGSMVWMSGNMQMTTSTGCFGRAFSRMFTGDTFFANKFTALNGPGFVGFASSFPGSIVPMTISLGREVIVQKSAFLASEEGVQLSLYFQKRVRSGLFGGEGFIMQKLSCSEIAFIEIDGHAEVYRLQPGEKNNCRY